MGLDTCMWVVPEHELTEMECKQLSYRLGEAVPDFVEWTYLRHPAPIWPDKDNPGFYEVDTWIRYYGPGYERGDFATIYMAALWLQANIGPVFYSSDSVWEPKPFDYEGMFAHWVKCGHLPYRQLTGELCGRCGGGQVSQSQWGPGNTMAGRCPGCRMPWYQTTEPSEIAKIAQAIRSLL